MTYSSMMIAFGSLVAAGVFQKLFGNDEEEEY